MVDDNFESILKVKGLWDIKKTEIKRLKQLEKSNASSEIIEDQKERIKKINSVI